MIRVLRFGAAMLLPILSLSIAFLPALPSSGLLVALRVAGVAGGFLLAGILAANTVQTWSGSSSALVAAAPALAIGAIFTVFVALRPLDFVAAFALFALAASVAAVGGAWGDRQSRSAHS